MNRKSYLLPLVLGATLFFAPGGGAGVFEFIRPDFGPVGEKHRPAVEAVAAQDEIEDGAIWKIYIRATDPDGDSDKVQITFSQLGTGMYSPEILILPTPQRRRTNGAVRIWASLVGGGSTDTIYGTAEVRVIDRAGNISGAKTLEFRVTGFDTSGAFVPPAGFDTSVLLGDMDFPLQSSSTNAKSE